LKKPKENIVDSDRKGVLQKNQPGIERGKRKMKDRIRRKTPYRNIRNKKTEARRNWVDYSEKKAGRGLLRTKLYYGKTGWVGDACEGEARSFKRRVA